ncbi:hypothetical protein HMPREF0072_0561, partial [Anaerococcus lactolyticus ATCC 51172]
MCLTVRLKKPNSESDMHLRIDRNASEPLVQQIVAGVSGWIRGNRVRAGTADSVDTP